MKSEGERMFGDKKLLIYNRSDGACSYYRSRLPYKFLKAHTKYVTMTEKIPIVMEIDNYYNDYFFLQRPETEFIHKEFIPFLKQNKKKLICDIDDNLFCLPWYNSAREFWTNKRLFDHATALAKSNLVTCSTVPLAEYVKKNFNTNVIVIPNMLDTFFPFKPEEHEKFDKVRIGLTGTITHNGDLSEALIKYLIENVQKKRIELICFGFCPNELKDVATIIPWCKLDQYYPTLNNLHIDIGLIVGKDNEFNASKSSLKYMEYSMLSIPSIADAIYPYVNTISHGKTGMLVNEPKNWKHHIDYLIENIPERKQMAYDAYTFVKENFYYGTCEQKMIDIYQQVFRSIR